MIKIISKHIPVLDGIRAYAVLLVCLVHFFQVDETALYETHKYVGIFLFKISQIGLRGVELFFLLSAKTEFHYLEFHSLFTLSNVLM